MDKVITEVGTFGCARGTMFCIDPRFPLDRLGRVDIGPCKADPWKAFLVREPIADTYRTAGLIICDPDFKGKPEDVWVHHENPGDEWIVKPYAVTIDSGIVGFFSSRGYMDPKTISRSTVRLNPDKFPESLWRELIVQETENGMGTALSAYGVFTRILGHGQYTCAYHKSEEGYVDCAYIDIEER